MVGRRKGAAFGANVAVTDAGENQCDIGWIALVRGQNDFHARHFAEPLISGGAGAKRGIGGASHDPGSWAWVVVRAGRGAGNTPPGPPSGASPADQMTMIVLLV